VVVTAKSCLRKREEQRRNMATALKLLTLALFFSVSLQGKEFKFSPPHSCRFLSARVSVSKITMFVVP
jgi:hypothetical protein